MGAPLILIEASPRRVSTGATETVRLAGGGGIKPYHYGGHHWRAGIAKLPTIVTALDFENGEFGTGAVPAASEVRWSPSSKADLAEMAAFLWKDAAITMRIGPEPTEGELPPVVLTGKVLETPIADGVMTIQFSDPAADLKKPLLTDRFAGTGGLEGPADWAGRIKQRSLGAVWNVPGEPLDPANNIWCFADPSRPLHAFDAVRDRGAAAASLTLLGWQGSAEATFAALQAAEAPQGGGVVAPSIACVKWWSAHARAITADIRGEVGSGYVETSAELAERIVAAAGGPAFTAGNVAQATILRPAPAGWLLKDETVTAASVLDQLLGNVSLLWVIEAAGTISIREWAWGAPVASARIVKASRVASFSPMGTRRLGYRRNELVMPRSSLAAIVLYGDGTPIEDLKPAQPGADVTGDNTSKDTENVNGVPASQVAQAVSDLADLQADVTAAEIAVAAAEAQIADLFATYGDTAGAAESAALAASHAGDAAASATVASTQQVIATDAAAAALDSYNLTASIVADQSDTIGTLSASVSSQASALATLETSFASLNTTVASHGVSISQQTTAITTLNGNVATLFGRWSVTVNVNGHVTGVALNNNGQTGAFAVLADVFSVTSPSGGYGLTWVGGILWNRGPSNSVLMGHNFGTSNDLLLWAGPTPSSPANVSKGSGVFWVDKNGSAQFGGSLPPGSVGNNELANGAITGVKIGNLEVTNAKIGNLQVGTSKIGFDAVTKINYVETGLIYINNNVQVTIASLTVTKDEADSVLKITVHSNARLQDNARRTNYIYVGGTVVWSSTTWPAGDDTTWSTEAYKAVVAGLSAGSHTISFRTTLFNGATTNFSHMSNTILEVEERKR
ncbi:hypothetical protein D2V17_14185 [Aurantiacibacter xanthus]|uniref:Tip attachment protein J domain-containing protein n=1 Tax=Aurantiacibacter xanthus TaxID=1784712 RepID=A0A3A1P1A8_9SPHN|nr:hypothetical protein [Aurantiacibacter xanthus]RIV82947.1 hypothetical protein D2V17_14185 [Aurantiacibacter xanthus]